MVDIPTVADSEAEVVEFLDAHAAPDVRVPDTRRLGPISGGWPVALTMLISERAPLGDGMRSRGRGVASLKRMVELLRHFDRASDPVLRQNLARVHSGFQVAKYTAHRAAVSSGGAGQQASILKLLHCKNLQATADFVASVLGPRMAADTGEWGTFAWAEFLLTVPGIRIAGGTDNIQRDTIAERVLGLPKEQKASSGQGS